MIIDKLKEYYYYSGVKVPYVINGTQTDKVIARTYLGTPVYSNLVLEPVTYRDQEDNVREFDGFRLDACLISANRENVIIETQVQGRAGSVNELISTGNYRITVNGFLIHQNSNVAPYVQAAQVNDAANVTTSMKVNSAFLNSLDIYEVICNNVTVSEIEGMRNMLAVTINLTSEIPIEVRLA